MTWFVVRTKPQQEFRAEENLTAQGFEAYLPVLTHELGKKEALFSGYLFLKNLPGREPFSKIRSTRGVLCLVHFGLNMATVEDAIIQEIRDRQFRYQNLARFKADDLVRVKEGPFAHLTGIYLCRSGEERAMILLKWLSRTTQVEIEEKLLVPA